MLIEIQVLNEFKILPEDDPNIVVKPLIVLIDKCGECISSLIVKLEFLVF